jgi:methyltransferase family protein
MISPGCCDSTDRHFTAARAQKELRRYRRRGPTGTTRRILTLLREAKVQVGTLLDVGGGIGVLSHELLAAGASSAVQVEAATAYLESAREEALRRGQSDRVRLVHGDAVDLAATLDAADLVTLDRVICCYPDFEPLLEATAGRAIRYWAASFPRERWLFRMKMNWDNARRAKAGEEFRSFVHPIGRIYAALAKSGLVSVKVHRGVFWEVVLCRRVST